MANISKIQTKSGTYNIKDENARSNIILLTNDITKLKNENVKKFDTLEILKNNENLNAGDLVITKGYYNINDGGHGTYIITNEPLTPNNGTIIQLTNNLFAQLVINNSTINVKQFGCYGDNIHDDLSRLQECLKYCSENKLKTFIPSGTYLINGQLAIYDYNVISGEDKSTTEIKTMNGVDLVYHTLVTENATNINSRLARNDDSPSISQGYPKVSEICTHYIHDFTIENLTINGNWQYRDLVNWNKYYNSPQGQIAREPGSAIELKRCYNFNLNNLLVINGPNHNITIWAGASSYNEGNTIVAQFPSYQGVIKNIETSNQRYDDCITTHDSEYITIENCYVHVDNNVNGTYSSAISNGIEIDDGSRYINVINCRSKYNYSGYQAKGHKNSPSAHNILFQNCNAEACHIAISISSNRQQESYYDIDNFCKDIIIKNFNNKYSYIYANNANTKWDNRAYEVLLDNCNNITIDGWTTIFGNPTDNIITNIDNSKPRTSTFENTNRNVFIKYNNIKVYHSQNDDNSTYPLFNIRGASRNFIITNVFCEGWSGYALIDYVNTSTNGYCMLDNITLLKRNNNDYIYKGSDTNLGTRNNLYLLDVTN